MPKSPKHKWNAADYASNSSLNLRGDETVLDIGCGNGKLTAALAQKLSGGFVQGVDSSAEMISFAAKSFPPSVISNLSFKVCDASRLTFSNKFDIVVSLESKNQWPGNVAVWGQRQRSGYFSRDRRSHCQGFIFSWHFYTPAEYGVWVQKSGLKLQRIELMARDMVQKSKDDLIGWARATWVPYVSRVPGGLQNEFLTEIVEHYLARYPLDEHGRAHVKMQRLEVEAYKEK